MKTIITIILIWALYLRLQVPKNWRCELFAEAYPRAMYFRIAEFI
jgi:hypothetical protein